MYILNKDIYQIHFFKSFSYIFLESSSSFMIANEIETIILKECISNNNVDFIINDLKTNYNILDTSLIKNTINSVIETFYNLLEIIDIPNNSFKNIIVTGNKNKKFPQSLQVYLTNQCPHKCVHCFQGNISNLINIDKFALFTMLNYLKGNTSQIQFSGGEPLLYPYICELIDNYYKDFQISITTSGYYLNNDILMSLKKCQTVQISLYSHISNIHNNFTKTNNSFENIIKNISKMVNNNINVGISHIITLSNYNKIEDFIKYCIQLNVSYIKFGTIIPIGRAKNKIEYILPTEIINYSHNNILKLKEKYKNKIFIFDWNKNNYGVGENFFKCGAGEISWSINENGEIYPCAFMESKDLLKGNIYDKDYINIINDNNTKYKFIDNLSSIKIDNININQICSSHI